MRSIGILAALALVACGHGSSGSSGDGAPPPDPFVGTWDCTGTQTLNFDFESGTMSSDTSYTAATVIITDDGDGSMTATLTADAGPACTRKFTVSGGTATLESGQSCTFEGLTFTYTSGTATLSGTSYIVTTELTLSGTITVLTEGGSPDMLDVTGTGETQSTCNEQ
jgi:hypothetical protein